MLVRKFKIAITNQLRNILYNILYKKKSILIRNLGHFLTISTLDQFLSSQSSISP